MDGSLFPQTLAVVTWYALCRQTAVILRQQQQQQPALAANKNWKNNNNNNRQWRTLNLEHLHKTLLHMALTVRLGIHCHIHSLHNNYKDSSQGRAQMEVSAPARTLVSTERLQDWLFMGTILQHPTRQSSRCPCPATDNHTSVMTMPVLQIARATSTILQHKSSTPMPDMLSATPLTTLASEI